MADIHVLNAIRNTASSGGPSEPTGGDGDNIDGMQDRVATLEKFAQDTRERLVRIETRLDQTATKTDLLEAVNGMIKWVVGTAFAGLAVFITVMTFVLNNAVPKAPATPVPIVIQLDGLGASGAISGAKLSVTPPTPPASAGK